MKKERLKIEKFRIVAFKNLSHVRGGTGVTTDTGSGDTTYTTDPAMPCPTDTEDV